MIETREPAGQRSLVGSVVYGRTADLMAEAARLHLRPHDRIVDLTFGSGRFWDRLDVDVVALDLDPSRGHACADLRAVPVRSGSVDVVALDPPFRPHHGGVGGLRMHDRYGLAEVRSMDDVVALYDAGIAEASRILRRGGRLLVKAQDAVTQSRFVPAAGWLLPMLDPHLVLVDLLVLASRTTALGLKPGVQQRTSRRQHSYLFVARRGR